MKRNENTYRNMYTNKTKTYTKPAACDSNPGTLEIGTGGWLGLGCSVSSRSSERYFFKQNRMWGWRDGWQLRVLAALIDPRSVLSINKYSSCRYIPFFQLWRVPAHMYTNMQVKMSGGFRVHFNSMHPFHETRGCRLTNCIMHPFPKSNFIMNHTPFK